MPSAIDGTCHDRLGLHRRRCRLQRYFFAASSEGCENGLRPTLSKFIKQTQKERHKQCGASGHPFFASCLSNSFRNQQRSQFQVHLQPPSRRHSIELFGSLRFQMLSLLRHAKHFVSACLL